MNYKIILESGKPGVRGSLLEPLAVSVMKHSFKKAAKKRRMEGESVSLPMLSCQISSSSPGKPKRHISVE
jgi:hypothetical protein